MSPETQAALREAGKKEGRQQRKKRGLPEYPTDPVVVQQCATLLRKAGARND